MNGTLTPTRRLAPRGSIIGALMGASIVALAATFSVHAQPAPAAGATAPAPAATPPCAAAGGPGCGPMGGPGAMGGMPGHGPGMRGHHHGAGDGPGLMGQRLDRMLDRVGATAEQKSKVMAIRQAAWTDTQALREQQHTLRQQLQAAFAAPTIDRARIESLRADLDRGREQLSRRMVQAMADGAEVLTPAQRAQMAQRMQQWRDGHGAQGRGPVGAAPVAPAAPAAPRT